MPVNDPARMFYEPPLARNESGPVSLAFDQCATVFAIDISGSTAGLILQEEKDAIESVVEYFPLATRLRSFILPWDDRQHALRNIASLASLKTDGGMTDPTVLTQIPETRKALLDSDLWFLLTDGLIYQEKVQAFAESIATHGLHSKACVLILFGYRPSRPIQCNISVGISVFAVTPDAIFLFHDVDTHEIFVFQTKGCFSNIRSKEYQGIVLNRETTWPDLPTMAYDQLFNARVPLSQSLQKNSIILQDRTQIDLDDLSNGALSKEQMKAVLGNEDNLKSVLLAMSTRGRQGEAKNWISQQRLNVDLTSTPCRIDWNGAARTILGKVIEALRERLPTKSITRLQQDLQRAHLENWKLLSASVDIHKKEATDHNTVLDSAIERLSMYNEIESPGLLSPIPLITRHDGESQNKQSSTDAASLMQDITFIPGFNLTKAGGKDISIKCPICGEISRHPALLLRKPPSAKHTPGFPLPMSCSAIAFPLALSSFRETDVVAQLVCCSTCAYYILQDGKSLYDEEIKGALPVTPSLSLRDNRQSWLTIVDVFFESRFEQRNLLPIMLSIMTDAQHRAAQGQHLNGTSITSVLAQACEQVREECKISYASGRLGKLDEAARFYLSQSPLNFHNELFDHPIDSFTLITCGFIFKDRRLVSSAIFMRIVLHIFSQFVGIRSTPVGAKSIEYLRELKKKGARTRIFDLGLQVRRDKVSIKLLSNHGLLEPTAIPFLEGLQPIWSELQTKAEPALYFCLFKLACEETAFTDARALLESWRTQEQFHRVFADPLSIQEEMISEIHNQP